MDDVIQLEKFEPNTVARVVPGITKRGRPVIAAAGVINAQNAYDYAKASAHTLVTSALFTQSLSLFKFESVLSKSPAKLCYVRITDLSDPSNMVAPEFSCSCASHLQQFHDAMR